MCDLKLFLHVYINTGFGPGLFAILLKENFSEFSLHLKKITVFLEQSWKTKEAIRVAVKSTPFSVPFLGCLLFVKDKFFISQDIS